MELAELEEAVLEAELGDDGADGVAEHHHCKLSSPRIYMQVTYCCVGVRHAEVQPEASMTST